MSDGKFNLGDVVCHKLHTDVNGNILQGNIVRIFERERQNDLVYTVIYNGGSKTVATADAIKLIGMAEIDEMVKI